MRIAISLITNDVRVAGGKYEITTDLRSKRFKYLDENGVQHSTEKNKGWSILPHKYIKLGDGRFARERRTKN